MAINNEVLLFGRYPSDGSRLIILTPDEPDVDAEEDCAIKVADTAKLRREIASIKKGSVI